MASVSVSLGERSYAIHIGSGLLDNLTALLRPVLTTKVVIISNDTIAPLFIDKVLQALLDFDVTQIIIPDGEVYKTVDQFNTIMTDLLTMRAARDTTIVALGGGVVGDIAGFAAATFQRGIPFIQVPTTLLAQVDSSVGGKTAVNHPLGKNMIGAFYQPNAVLIDTDTLASLPEREFSAGMAEVIKYGIIYDLPFFVWLEENRSQIGNRDQQALAYVIKRCCEIKAEIVSLDETEKGIRAILNLGHTFGHAIEAEMGFGEWLHGEAVAAGIILACEVAKREFDFSVTEYRRVVDLLRYFKLPVVGPVDMVFDDYIKHMQHDKKVANNKIRFVIPTQIGHADITDTVKQSTLEAVLNRKIKVNNHAI
jgi:3-dehydroquinate synthase